MDKAALEKEVQRIKAALERARARCRKERREPTRAEIQTATDNLARLEEIEALLNGGSDKMANLQLLQYMAKAIEAENRKPTEDERRIAREASAGIPETETPGFWKQSAGRAYYGDPQDNGDCRNVTFNSRSHPGLPQGGDRGGFQNIGDYFATLVRDPSDIRLRRQQMAAMEVGTFSEGGSMVPESFSNMLIGLIVEKSIILPRADVYTMTGPGDVLKIPAIDDSDHSSDRGGLVATWTGEGQTISPDQIRTRQLALSPKKLTLLVKCSREYLQDAVNAEKFVMDTMTGEAAWQLDHALIQGSGAGEPLGILNAPDLLTVAAEGGQAPASYLWENCCTQFQALNPSGDDGAIWLFSPSLKKQLFSMGIVIGTGGIGMWPALTQATGRVSLLGKETFFTEHLPVAGQVGDSLLVSPQALAVAIKQQVQIDTSNAVFFTTDFTAFKLTLRLDAQSKYSAPLTLHDGVTQTSNFICLAAR